MNFSKSVLILPNRFLCNSNRPCIINNGNAVLRRGFARRAAPPHNEAAREQQRQDFEDVLNEKQSEKLYGLSGVTSNLQLFAQQLEQGSLNLFPEYQRSYVWKPDKASRLIVTALCNRFVPPIVVHEKEKGLFDVVDGKQRLASLLGFYLNREKAPQVKDSSIRSKLETILPDLKVLSKLDESYEDLNGLSFDDLSEERKRAFESYSISYLVIPYGTKKTDVFEVYEDINSGGEHLTAQQVRRAVFHGPYIKLLDELAETCSDFQAIFDPKAHRDGSYQPCVKNSDRELILRAFAFRERGADFKVPMKSFLNREMEGTDDYDGRGESDKKRIHERLQARKEEFTQIMRVARNLFGAQAFRKKSQGKRPEPTMWDAMYCALAETLKQHEEIQFIQAKDEITNTLKTSLTSGFFSSDDNVTAAKKFLSRKDELKAIFRESIAKVAKPRDSVRSFDPLLRETLFQDQNGVCAICQQSIDESRLAETNYVHIDHIVPHAKGGPTSRDNAQLTHAICNLSKSMKL